MSLFARLAVYFLMLSPSTEQARRLRYVSQASRLLFWLICYPHHRSTSAEKFINETKPDKRNVLRVSDFIVNNTGYG